MPIMGMGICYRLVRPARGRAAREQKVTHTICRGRYKICFGLRATRANRAGGLLPFSHQPEAYPYPHDRHHLLLVPISRIPSVSEGTSLRLSSPWACQS